MTALTVIVLIAGAGYLISVRIHSQLGASQIALMLTMLPTTMLSGYTFPIDQMPPAIRAVSLLVYARYYVTILRDVFLKGSSLGEMAGPIFALALYAGLGFAEIGRRPRYYADPIEDAVLMRLWLR